MLGTNLPDPTKFNFSSVVRKQNHMKMTYKFTYTVIS